MGLRSGSEGEGAEEVGPLRKEIDESLAVLFVEDLQTLQMLILHLFGLEGLVEVPPFLVDCFSF